LPREPAVFEEDEARMNLTGADQLTKSSTLEVTRMRSSRKASSSTCASDAPFIARSRTWTESMPSWRRATATVGERFSSIRSLGGFTGPADARIGKVVTPGERYIGLGEVGVVLEDRRDGLSVSELTDVPH
jgi:hypothetical protein